MSSMTRTIQTVLAVTTVSGAVTAWSAPGTLRVAQLDAEAPSSATTDNRGLSPTKERAESRKMEEVIVTAQKRQESLQEVPISISVLGGEKLDESSFTSVNDALRTVPGVVMYENLQAGMSKVAVRGVASNPSLFNGSSTVGYYLDEIPFSFVRFPVTPDTNVYDLERVEVLRGPQGTLYGASSLNGVVRVLTQKADRNELEFKTRTTLSSTEDGGDNYRGDVAVNIPIVPEKLAIRAVGGYADNSGWIDQPQSGKEDVNESIQKNLRFKVNAAPTDAFGVELMVWFSRDDRDATNIARDDRTSLTFFPESNRNKFNAYGVTLTYDFPSVSLLSATNHVRFFGASMLNNPAGVRASDVLITHLFGELTSQEFRLSSRSDGPWVWSAGAIYRDETDRTWQDFTSATPPGGLVAIADNVYESKSYAVFGELSRMLLGDRVKITAGLRYFEDDSSSNEVAVFTPADPPFGLRGDTFDALTPRVVVEYRPNDLTSFYASYAQGFRSGFSQNGQVLRVSQGLATAVRPDRLHNYEIGTKGMLFGDRVSYDVAAYYIDWEDTVQVAETRVFSAGGGFTGFFGAVNSEGVAGSGVDVATTLRLTDRLRFSAAASWNDLQFREDVLSGPAILYPRDSRPPESSETTANGALSYEMSLPGGYAAHFDASATYLSKLLSPAATVAAAQAGDDLLIARASFTLSAPVGWSAMLFADNLTDEDGKIRPIASTGGGSSDRLRPRTYGLQLEYKF